MKTIIQNIVVTYFGLYFLIAGMGFNVVNYCCEQCEDEGIESVALNTCEAVHHHQSDCCNHESTEDVACSDLNHHPNSCHMMRLRVEVPPIASAIQLKFNTNFVVILFAVAQNLLIESQNVSKFLVSALPPPDNVLCHDGREILTSKAVLII